MFSSNTTQVSDGGYQISRSLRFNSADSAYLNRTPASAGNRRTWTWSAWIKRSNLNSSGEKAIFIVGTTLNEGGYFNIAFSSDKFVCGTGAAELRATTAVYRDISALLVGLEKTANYKISMHESNLKRLKQNPDLAAVAQYYELPTRVTTPPAENIGLPSGVTVKRKP